LKDLDGAILVLNAGSSSLKLAAFDAGEQVLVADLVEWLSNEGPTLEEASTAIRRLLDGSQIDRIAAVGHRVVHGGDRYEEAAQIDATVKDDIRTLGKLAPLHNPAALTVIEAAEQLFPGMPQVAAFDTAFHAALPAAASIYPTPYHWYKAWGIRRFGFHGLSHAYCASRAAELVARPLAELRTIVCHLGAGCSLAAIAGGRSVATTMGFTPLDGIPMATRPGSLDPGILINLLATHRLSLDELSDALTHDAGLKGISGLSGDMRDLLTARGTGHTRAQLAIEVFTSRIRQSIGAMTASLSGLDVLVFTAGIGEHAPVIRQEICQPLGWLGVQIDTARNLAASRDVDIGSDHAPVRVLVIHTREDLIVARETRRVMSHSSP
jgi:acetate kinase